MDVPFSRFAFTYNTSSAVFHDFFCHFYGKTHYKSFAGSLFGACLKYFGIEAVPRALPSEIDAITITNYRNTGKTRIFYDETIARLPPEQAEKYKRSVISHEMAHLFLGHTPRYSMFSLLPNSSQNIDEMRSFADTVSVMKILQPKFRLNDEELAEIVASLILVTQYQKDSQTDYTKIDSYFFQHYSKSGFNARVLSNKLKMPIDCIIKLVGLYESDLDLIHYFKWNLVKQEMEDWYASSQGDISSFNPFSKNFWTKGKDTAVGHALSNKDDMITFTTTNPKTGSKYRCSAYYEHAVSLLNKPAKVYVLGNMLSD